MDKVPRPSWPWYHGLEARDTAKMAEASENIAKNGKTSAGKRFDRLTVPSKVEGEVSDYVDRLSNEHRMLVILKAQLYDGTWDSMLDDLKNRLAGKPYIFKLANRINDDIARIEEMQKFEAKHNINLAEYVKM